MKFIYSNNRKTSFKVSPKQFEILLKENLIEYSKDVWTFDEDDENEILEKI